VPGRTGGKPQYHPRLMLALLIYSVSDAPRPFFCLDAGCAW